MGDDQRIPGVVWFLLSLLIFALYPLVWLTLFFFIAYVNVLSCYFLDVRSPLGRALEKRRSGGAKNRRVRVLVGKEPRRWVGAFPLSQTEGSKEYWGH